MSDERERRENQVFTLRLWQERLAPTRWEWRGELVDVTSGERRYFRNWPGLVDQLRDLLPVPLEKK